MNDSIIKIKQSNFDPSAVFTCGQCFRWLPESDGSFTGVAYGRVLNVSAKNDTVTFRGCSKEDFEEVWRKYFDLDRDYSEITDCLSKIPSISSAVAFGSGIRILRQDFFECLLSFIISANNNIPRIRGIINKMSLLWGERLSFDEREYYAFPKPSALCGITEGDLAPLHSGYRAKYIENTVRSIISGEVSFEGVNSLPTPLARKELMRLCGVGPKVADCILLFSFGRFDVFPTDVWVKRVMNELFGCPENRACAMGSEMFGALAGIAQQYLFYERRDKSYENEKKEKSDTAS